MYVFVPLKLLFNGTGICTSREDMLYGYERVD